MMRLICFLLLAIYVTSCSNPYTSDISVEGTKPELSSAEIAKWNTFLGAWYGSQPEGDRGTYEWLIKREIDGFYVLRTRHTKADGTYKDYEEIGEWGVSGPIYFSIVRGWPSEDGFEPVDKRNPIFRSAYFIIDINEKEFRYRAYSDGSEFKAIKVSDDFEL